MEHFSVYRINCMQCSSPTLIDPVRRVSNQPDGVCSQTNFSNRHTHADPMKQSVYHSDFNFCCIKGAKTHIEEIPDILRIYNPEDVSV